jgi:hypothetical protein
MATLIVTRARESSEGLLHRPFHILIDGLRVTSIGACGTVEIALTPGRHQVTVRSGFVGSQGVEVEAVPGGVYSFRVASNSAAWERAAFTFILLGTVPCVVLLVAETLIRDPFEKNWFGLFTIPMVMFLPLLTQLVFTVVWRDHFFALEKVPTLDPGARRVVLPKVQPQRVRITIRAMMIAVAVLALFLGAGLEWARYARQDYFRAKTSQHAHFESICRQAERDLTLMSGGREVGKSAARANFHAAMRRKYEAAAARDVFLVEPDPPAPPWP